MNRPCCSNTFEVDGIWIKIFFKGLCFGNTEGVRGSEPVTDVHSCQHEEGRMQVTGKDCT